MPRKAQTTEVEKTINSADLAEVATFEAAVQLAADTYGGIVSAGEFGDGFEVLKDKDKRVLIGKDLIILDYVTRTSDEHYDADGTPSEYVLLKVMTRDNRKYVVVDGGVGIKAQLDVIRRKTQRNGGIAVIGGLTESEYTYTGDDGSRTKASTFYLSENLPA